MRTTRYRCGPRSEPPIKVGCGGIFECDDGPDELSSPMRCPLCRATFCGEQCCGNEAEMEREYIFDVPGAYNAGELRHPEVVIRELYPEAWDLKPAPIADCWSFRAFPMYPQKSYIEIVW